MGGGVGVGGASMVWGRESSEGWLAGLFRSLEAFMYQQAVQFIEAHPGPLLISAQGDCTPTSTRFVAKVSIPDHSAWRSGRHSAEFIMQKWFFVAWQGDDIDVCCLFRDPYDMSSTSAWQYFLAHNALMAPSVTMRSCRLTWHHAAYDRAGFSAVTRMIEQMHKLFSKHAGSSSAASRQGLDAFNIDISTPCAAHDVGGSIRWSSRTLHPSDPELAKAFYKNLHIGIAAQRNALDVLVLNVISHVEDIVWDGPFDRSEEAYQVWSLLDMPEHIAEPLALLNPRRINNKLHCNLAAREQWDEPLTMISQLFIFIWRFRMFTESRFGSFGVCLRILLAALLICTDVYVARLLATPGIRKHFLSGFKKLNQGHYLFAAVLSMSTRVPEALMRAVLKDDRLARRPQYYLDVVAEEMSRLAQLPDFVFSHIASILEEVSGNELKHLTVQAAQVSIAYLDRFIFQELRSPPWTLAAGDIRENLTKLAVAGLQENAVLEKIRCLLVMKWPLDELERFVKLLHEVRWSTLPVEQMHGSLAVTKKYHPMYGVESLSLRSFCHMVLPMMKPAKQDHIIYRCESRLAACARRRPEFINGFNILVRNTIASAHDIVESPADGFQAVQHFVARAATVWSSMSSSSKATYSDMAASSRRESRAGIRAEIQRIRKLRQDRLDKLSAEDRPKGLVADIRFDEAAMEKMQRLFSSSNSGFSVQEVARLREQARRGPDSPDENVRLLLLQEDHYKRPWLDFAKQAWLSDCCRLRDAMVGVAVRFSLQEHDPWYLFQYASQNPLQASFLELHKMEPYTVVEQDDLRLGIVVAPLWNLQEFSVNDYMCVKHEFELPDVHPSDCVVITDLVLTGEGCYSSKNSIMAMDAFYMQFGSSSATDRKKERPAADKDLDLKLAEQYPWLKQHIAHKAGMGDGAGGSSKSRVPKEPLAPLDEDMLRGVDEATELMRAEWQRSHGPVEKALTHFRVEHRGGKWTAQHRGVPVDSCRGRPSSKPGHDFIRKWRLQGVFTNSFALYGQANAELLSLSWCHKMAYFTSLWLHEEGNPAFAFDETHSLLYRELDELSAAAAEWAPGSPQMDRLTQLRALAPLGLAVD